MLLSNPFAAMIDACALVGARKRDLLMSFAWAGLFRPLWCDMVMREVERTLGRLYPDHIKEHTQLVNIIRSQFPSAMIERYDYVSVDLDQIPDVSDVHVIKAAVAGRADVVVTDNLRHFPKEVLNEFELEALSTDTFLTQTTELFRGEALQTISIARKKLSSPPYQPSEYIMDLTRKGLPKLAAYLREYRDYI